MCSKESHYKYQQTDYLLCEEVSARAFQRGVARLASLQPRSASSSERLTEGQKDERTQFFIALFKICTTSTNRVNYQKKIENSQTVASCRSHGSHCIGFSVAVWRFTVLDNMFVVCCIRLLHNLPHNSAPSDWHGQPAA